MIAAYRLAAIALGIAGIIAGIFMGGMRYERANWQARWAERDAKALQDQAQQEVAARNTEQARQRQNQEIQAHATQEIDKARADANAGRADADRLRKQVAVLSAKRCPASDPGTATSSEAADPAAVLLADVFGWADDRATDLAAAYDRARIAGLACEDAYDSLRRQQ